MATFMLLDCLHYMRIRDSVVDLFDNVYCPKCADRRVVMELHASSFKVVCTECRYRYRVGSNRAAQGFADRHYRSTGHDAAIMVEHPAIPGGAVEILQAEKQVQLELPMG